MTTVLGAPGVRPASVDAVFDRPGSVRALAVLRIALGPIVIAHLWPFLVDTWRGETYDERFFEPWWGFVPDVPGSVQVVLVWGAALAAVPLALGWRTRWVGAITWLGVAGNFFLSQHHFRHNRAFLLFLLGAVVLGESGRVLSLDARRRRAHGLEVADRATLWPLWLLRVLASSVYFASGFSKLIDTDWASGLVLWDRAVRYQQFVRDSILPEPVAELVVDVVTARWFHTLTSPLAIAMELFIAVGLWFGPTRLAAIWTALFFHASIEVSASVEVFSLAAMVATVIWVTPATRDRTITADPSTARWLRRLDWLARFHVVEQAGAPLSVVDRDGWPRTGRDARWLAMSRLPLLFPVVAPLRWWWR